MNTPIPNHNGNLVHRLSIQTGSRNTFVKAVADMGLDTMFVYDSEHERSVLNMFSRFLTYEANDDKDSAIRQAQIERLINLIRVGAGENANEKSAFLVQSFFEEYLAEAAERRSCIAQLVSVAVNPDGLWDEYLRAEYGYLLEFLEDAEDFYDKNKVPVDLAMGVQT